LARGKTGDDDDSSPTRDQTIEMLRGGSKSRRRWDERFGGSSELELDLSGASLRGLDLRGLASLQYVNLERADLSRTKLDCLPDGNKGAKFDGAHFSRGSLYAIDCSMKGIRIEKPTFVDVSGSDLTGATLTGSRSALGRYTNAVLRKVKFQNWSFRLADLAGADLTGADLRKTKFTEARAPGATFAGANLAGVDLSEAVLTNADLRGADLRRANLTYADLRGADVAGANFEGAVLLGTKLAKVDTSPAKGLALSGKHAVTGSYIKKLEKLAPKAKRLESEVRVDVGKRFVVLSIDAYGGYGRHVHYRTRDGNATVGRDAPTMDGAFKALCKRFLRSRLRPDTLTVKSKQSPVSGAELRELFLGAWREAMGADATEAKDAAKEKKTGAQRAAALLDLLRGKGGVAQWNKRSAAERTPPGGFRGADLSNATLRGVDFAGLEFQKAKLDGADLTGADLLRCKLAGASFAGATLTGANLGGAELRGANFRGARLARADFEDTDLRKVDFTDAKLAGAELKGAVFDETTILPLGFQPPKEMVWKGKAADPRVAIKMKVAAGAPKVIDADALIKRLVGHTDWSRFENAMKMLKADRFKLFVEVNDERLAGVVKSQTNKELVYACSLAADGAYACCSQNLNICGGLRGALCKHLLVLIVGLVKSGGVDPTSVDAWIRATLRRGPALDKDAMGRILLRFKGAEAGEIDWRPTETVPEDYYAM